MQERNIFKSIAQNKWLCAFLGTALALIVAIVAIIVISVNANKPAPDLPPEDNGPVVIPEGEESGVYYYGVAGGEVVLTFNSGNKFTLAGPTINKSGEYTVNGTTVTLDFVRDEDGTATATLGKDSVVVVYNDATMTFLRKVNFNVAFDTDGGSEIAAVQVLNGQSLAAPTVPTKADSVFLGWYTDAAFKNAFEFGVDLITADTTLYARWAKTSVGQAEYTISFDLGYEGAAALAPADTIGGKLYLLDTPAREGYTFQGWYVSMYQDGAKLSYEYKEDMVFDANTTLFALWTEDAATKLASPAVTVNGNTVTWKAVTGASGYIFKVTDAAGTVLVEKQVGATDATFDFAALAAGDYVISVTAKASDAANNSEPALRYLKNKALSRVSKFQVIDGVLAFNAVEGAQKYLVTVDCGNKAHNHVEVDIGSYTSYDLSNCTMQQGGIKITVTAVADSYASSVSDAFVYNRSLSAIGNITYNETTDTFVWDAVENAATYEVTVTIGDKVYVINNGNKTTFSVANYTGDIKVSVLPKTAGYNSPAPIESACQKTAPVTPSGLQIIDMLLTWNAVEGATSYQVKIGNQIYDVTGTSLDLSNPDFNLSIGETYDISVKAFKNEESSAFSAPVSIGYFVMNPELSYKNNSVFWTPVIGVTNFEVRVNGGTPIKVTDANSAKVTLTKAGANLIEVRFTDRGGSAWAHIVVNAYEIIYKSLSVNGGDFVEYLVIGDEMCPPEAFSNQGYDFDGWYNAPGGASGNGKEYEGSVFTGNKNLILYANWKPQTYNLLFQTEGMNITNIAQGDKAAAVYGQSYKLPVPVTSDLDRGEFVGWYLGQSMTSTRLTDEFGNSLNNSAFLQDTVIYPVFTTGVLSFELKSDDTYAVTAGPNFDKLANVTVPVTYNGKPVTSIVENAFANHRQLVTIDIPNTIQLVGSGAFTGNSKLESINVYEVEGTHEVFYSSADGALIRHDMGTSFLEVFPRAKTGTFKVPENVTTLRNKVFQFSNIDTIIISKDVTTIQEKAFYYCEKLTTVEFEGDRTSSVTVEDGIFYATNNIKSIKLPAMIDEFNYSMFDELPHLALIEVEEGGTNYASIDGILTNGVKDTILYAPLTISGTFTVPRGVQYIAPDAFRGRTSITRIIIPNYVKEIGAYAFDGCIRVKSITFNGSREFDLTIGNNAFSGCIVLDEVTFLGNGSEDVLDAGAITIGNNAFYPASGGANLRSLTFGNGVNIASIGSSAFRAQSKLYKLVFEKNINITKIGASAFESVTALQTLEIPASVTEIGSKAFYNCSGLSSITFNEGSSGNITFGASAFAECVKITSVYLPSTVEAFNGTVFNGCDALTKIEVSPENPYLESSADGVLYNETYSTLLYYPRGLNVDKDTLDALPWDKITKIGDAAFAGHAALTSFEIKKGVTEIGAGAFEDCAALAALTYEAGGNGPLSIGKNAFNDCKAMTQIALPDYTTAIGDGAFKYTAFETFETPAALTTLGAEVFMHNKTITAFNITANIESIGNGAFSNCTKLATVTVDDSANAKLFTLGTNGGTSGVFAGCSALKTIDLKNRVTVIGNYAFKSSGLTSITIGSNVTTIGNSAFLSSKITTIFIPKTVMKLDNYSLSTSTLQSVEFEMGGTDPLAIGTKVFENASKLTEVTFPKRVLSLESDTSAGTSSTAIKVSNIADLFAGCTALKNVNVEAGGKSYTSIAGVLYKTNDAGVPVTLLFVPALNEGNAANNELIIPKTVTLVENRALRNITKIKTVTFEEFDKSDANYGKQLLHIGRGELQATVADTYTVIGGDTTSASTSKNTITTINLPSHLATFGAKSIGATKGTVSLNINPDASEITICYYAFQYARIQNYVFPGVKQMATFAFAGCFNGFTTTERNSMNFTIVLGNKSTLTELPQHSFNGTLIKEFTIPASVKTLTQPFYNSKLTTVTFAEGSQLEIIGSNSFALCSNLANLDLSSLSNLKEIGNHAFQYCAFTSLSIPETVTTIGLNAFDGCRQMQTIHLPKTFTPDMLYPIDNSGKPVSIFGTLTSTGMYNKGESELKSITVDPENPVLQSIGGVLYDKPADASKPNILYCFPSAKSTLGYKIPDSVTQIAGYAFKEFKGTSLTLPAGLTTIDGHAFEKSALTSICIPKGVTALGEYSFASIQALKTVTFEAGSQLTSIGDYAFYWQNGTSSPNSLENVQLPDSVETMGAYAFYGCVKLTSMTLPSALSSIEKQTFQNCVALEEIVLQQNITSIGDNSFAGTALKEIEIPAAVQSIGKMAFNKVTTLKKVTFVGNSQLDSLGGRAFENCTALESINLPASLSELLAATNNDLGIFKNCTSLEEISIPGVSSIPAQTFEGCTSLKTVVLGDSLTEIGAKAFYGNTSLESIEIPATVTTIGTSAFENCTSLKSAIFADGNAMLGLGTAAEAEDNIFKNTPALETVVLPNTLEFIGGHVFENSGIAEVSFSAMTELTSIGDYSFANCDNLERVAIPANVIDLGDYAFFDCDNLESAALTIGLEYLGELAFGSCNKLTAGNIPASVFFLNGNPFAGCVDMPIVTIDPENTYFTFDDDGSIYSADKTTLHYYSNTNTTENVVLSSTITKVAPGAFAGAQLKSISIPAKIGEIAASTFTNCTNLESVTIAEGITAIGAYAFDGCVKLNNVTIPESATNLGKYAFANCSSLSNFSFASTTATYTIGTHFFENCVSITEVILPAKHIISDEQAFALGSTYITKNSNSGAITRRDTMKAILPDYMFAGTGIETAIVPSTVTYLEADGVFANCADLEAVIFEAPTLTYTYLGNYMFYNCDSLVDIEIPNGNTSNPFNSKIGYTFAECDNLETVTVYFKSSASSAGGLVATAVTTPTAGHMFENCKNLKDLILYDVSKPINNNDEGGEDDGGVGEDDGGGAIGGGGSIIGPGIGGLGGLGTASIGSQGGMMTAGLGAAGGSAAGGSAAGGSAAGGSTIGGAAGGSTIGGAAGGIGGIGGTTPGFGTPEDDEPEVEEGAQYARGYLSYVGPYYFAGCTSLESFTVQPDAYIGDYAFAGCTALKEFTFYVPETSDEGGDDDGIGEDEGEAPGIGGGGSIIGPGIGGLGGLGTASIGSQGGMMTAGLGTAGGSAAGGSTIGGIGTGGSAGGSAGGSTIGGIGTGGTTPGFGTPDDEPAEDEETEDAPQLQYLGSYAFAGCTALTEINLPALPDKVGTNVFDGWTSDQTINLSGTGEDASKQIEAGMFEGCGASVLDKDGNAVDTDN